MTRTLLALAPLACACAPEPPPTLPPSQPVVTHVVSTVPSASVSTAEPADLGWVRDSTIFDFTYATGTVATSYEFRAHLGLVDGKLDVDEALALDCPPAIVAKCSTLRRTLHRNATLAPAVMTPILEAMAKARRAVKHVVQIADEGLLQRTLVVQRGGYGAPQVASLGATNDLPVEIATNQTWLVDDASARTLRDGLDALARALGAEAWVAEETARWLKSP